jgi:outer membrane protein assembly factor BamD
MRTCFKKSSFFFLPYLLAFALIFLQGCATETEEEYKDRPVEELYNTAMDTLEEGNYEKAAKAFDEVDRQHPYSKWATKAQIMSAFAYYESQNYEKALANLESFIQLHPAHPDVAYAYYLKGLCHYEEIYPIRRDQHTTELALSSFQDLIKRFPSSQYARDAQVKIDLLYDTLAGKQMTIARDYLRAKAYIAALGRFQSVVERYQTTSHIPEALHRIVEIYLTLGLKEDAKKTAVILGYNYPGSVWYADSYYMLEGVDVRPDEYKDRSTTLFYWPWTKHSPEKYKDETKSRF